MVSGPRRRGNGGRRPSALSRCSCRRGSRWSEKGGSTRNTRPGIAGWRGRPGRPDYLALASLPVRSRQVFTARFLSVLLFSAALIAAMNLLPSLIAPMEFGGAWRVDSSYWPRAGAQAVSSGLACFFVFFAILALQGVLLNVLPARLFARVSVYAQGALAGVFLLGGLYSCRSKSGNPRPSPDWENSAPGFHQSGLRASIRH